MVMEKEALFTWILNPMSSELAKQCIEYKTIKEIREAAHKNHSKQNDRLKNAQLVNCARVLWQGDKSVLIYATELSSIYSELDHCRPPVHYSLDRDIYSWME